MSKVIIEQLEKLGNLLGDNDWCQSCRDWYNKKEHDECPYCKED